MSFIDQNEEASTHTEWNDRLSQSLTRFENEA